MNQKLLAGIIIGIVVVLVVMTFLVSGVSITNRIPNQISNNNSQQVQNQFLAQPTPTQVPGETVMVSAHGFVPETMTLKSGSTVNFGNFSDSDKVEVVADDAKDTLLNTGVIKNNDTSDPVKLSVGTHKFHNKFNPSQTGTIIVQ